MTASEGGQLLNLLLFSLGGVRFALDAEQVAGIAAYQEDEGEELFWLHQELGYKEKTVAYRSPAVITLATPGSPTRLVVDSLEDFAEFALHELKLLPPLLEPLTLKRGIWAVLPGHGRLILLLDGLKLLGGRKAKFAPAPN